MALLSLDQLAVAFGILGNIVSFLVYLAPVPTFYGICKKKSTEGFQSIPYAVALFSCMLYLYYAFLKQNVLLLITINSVGCVMEIAFLTIYVIYATKESKAFTIKIIFLFNVALLGLIIACTNFALEDHIRVNTVGWICSGFSICVFAAPLSILRQVIRTKSVEYMPFWLSFFLTICAVMWFFYGLLIHDYFIAAPNILGFGFGLTQMLLYVMYKNRKQQVLPEAKVDNFTIERKSFDQIEDHNSVIAANNEQELKMIVVEQVPGNIVLAKEEDSKANQSEG